LDYFGREAQRLAAQRLGHDRLVVTILTGNLELHSSILSLSLGQVSCSGVLGVDLFCITIIKLILIFIFLKRMNCRAASRAVSKL
jgi:hypothetical protein